MSSDVIGIIAPHPPIMVPEVGGRDTEITAASTDAMMVATKLVSIFDPDAIVLMSPHAPILQDSFAIDASHVLAGDLGQFGASQMHITTSGDSELAEAIVTLAAQSELAVVPRTFDSRLHPGVLDHGALVPLSFIDRSGRWPLIEISLSWLPLHAHEVLGQVVRRAASKLHRRVAFIASGDCSHRLLPGAPAGYDPRGKEFDAELVRLIHAGDYAALKDIDPRLVEAAGECGLRSFVTLGGFLEGEDADTRVLAYEGPWGVGYLTALAGPSALLDDAATPVQGRKGGTPGAAESEPVVLARAVIESYVREGRVPQYDHPARGLLSKRAGAFVSLHRQGNLRGCIGTTGATQDDLADEIAHNAIQAATSDPRFPPMAAEELDDLEISVDVLHEPTPATMTDLEPHTYGVIVSADWRRGLLLPDLEGVDTAEEQVSIAMRKAGISPNEKVRLERFRVDRYH